MHYKKYEYGSVFYALPMPTHSCLTPRPCSSLLTPDRALRCTAWPGQGDVGRGGAGRGKERWGGAAIMALNLFADLTTKLPPLRPSVSQGIKSLTN